MKQLTGRAKVSAKGWIVIPKEIRDEMGLRPGDEVRFNLWPPEPEMKQDRRLMSLHVRKGLSQAEAIDVADGMMKPRKGKPLTQELVEERRRETDKEERELRAQKRRRKQTA